MSQPPNTTPQAPAFRFSERLRVRWAEVDMQKIVFNGHYLMYVDSAMAGYWRALALDYGQTMAAVQGDLFVKKAGLEYHASAEYDDLLAVRLRCAHLGRSSLRFDAAVQRGEEILVTAELLYVFADPVAKRSKALPPDLRALFQAYEAGASMLAVTVGPWADLGDEARQLRQEVLVEEQGIALPLAEDDADPQACHVVVRNRMGFAQATARLLPARDGVAWLGRVAVRRALRGSGLGQAAMAALVQVARLRGDRALRLHAQASAVSFYLRAGFVPFGPSFNEAGRAHQEMVLALA